MANQGAIRRFERLCYKLVQLRDVADKETLYYKKEDGVNTCFAELADAINGAVTESRRITREIQSLEGHATIPHKRTVKKTTAKSRK